MSSSILLLKIYAIINPVKIDLSSKLSGMSIEIIIRKDIELGAWQGLGGAITEATAYNFAKLNHKKQQELLSAYYDKNGLDYRWARLSIGSNDFCLKPFEYTTRPNLDSFSVKHDERWLFPMLKKITTKKKLTFLASPWSPPKYMKFTRKNHLSGILKPWYYGKYGDYIHKWLNSYRDKGIEIDYITPQNEPFAFQSWESCVFSYREQKKLAYKYLAKELKSSKTQILLWDHNKRNLSKVADKLLGKNYRREDKIAGICYHWYSGTFPNQMWKVRQKYPDILMISSEMCCHFTPYNEEEWQNDAKLYLYELFNDINSGTNAFIDWNMLLNWQGGPNHKRNYTKSPVILNEKGDDFILTPIYYALKKFAKLFPAGSEIVRCEYNSKDIAAITKKTKAGYTVIIANLTNKDQEITLKLGRQTKKLTLEKSKIIAQNI